MHSCKNISAALAYALEVEAARTASRRPVMIHQIRKENPKEPKSPSSKGFFVRSTKYVDSATHFIFRSGVLKLCSSTLYFYK